MIARFDGESAGTILRVSATRRAIEGCLERLARSMQIGSAFFSLAFYDDHRSARAVRKDKGGYVGV